MLRVANSGAGVPDASPIRLRVFGDVLIETIVEGLGDGSGDKIFQFLPPFRGLSVDTNRPAYPNHIGVECGRYVGWGRTDLSIGETQAW